jgi:hypothetical protein
MTYIQNYLGFAKLFSSSIFHDVEYSCNMANVIAHGHHYANHVGYGGRT